MKKIQLFLLAAVAVMGLTMCSQNKQGASDEAVDSAAVMPEFPGGSDSLVAYLASAISYPQQAVQVGMEGRVLVGFVVEKDGSIGDVQVEESVDSLLDGEAVRVVAAMPVWTPGQDENGEAVRVKYSIPINFTIPATVDEIDEQPEFPGGMDGLTHFLIENVKYPEVAKEKGIQGRVLVRFVIDEAGKVVGPKVVRPVNEYLDAEALRVVNAMPKWTPGKNGGKPVGIEYTLPVTFRLQ